MTKIALIIAALAVTATAGARAAPLSDAIGDFIPTYTGPLNGDLDVLSSQVSLKSGVFEFAATFGGAVGTTPGGFYVFGVDRGAGTARFGVLADNVLFDSVVVINNSGTGFARDLLSGTTIDLAPAAISFAGATLNAFVDLALLPSAGFAPTEYTYNLWPRSAGVGTATIADFAPDNANAAITAVPEPASWALMIAGFGLVGASARRRRLAQAAA